MSKGKENRKQSMMNYLLKFCLRVRKTAINQSKGKLIITGSNNLKGVAGVGKQPSSSDRATRKFSSLSIL